MSTLELVLWMWAAWAGGWSLYTYRCAWREMQPRMSWVLGAIATVEAVVALWAGSWAWTTHALAVAFAA